LKAIKANVDNDPVDLKWSAEYEHYQRPESKGVSDSKVLSGNAKDTERLKKEFGIILGSEAGRTKVEYIERDSRAQRAGIETNDFIISINGKPADYMGIFDIASEITSKDHGGAALLIERERKFWISEAKETGKASLKNLAGFSLSGTTDKIFISGIEQDSSAYQSGLRKKDLIVAINGSLDNASSKEAVIKAIREKGLGYINVTLRREIGVR